MEDLNDLLKYDFNLSIRFDPLKAALTALSDRQTRTDASLLLKADRSACDILAEGAAAANSHLQTLDTKLAATDKRVTHLATVHEEHHAATRASVDGLDARVQALEAGVADARAATDRSARASADALAAAEDAASRAASTDAALRDYIESAAAAAAASGTAPAAYVPPPPRPAAADAAAVAAATEAAAAASAASAASVTRLSKLEADNASLRSLLERALERLGAVEEGAAAATTAHGALQARVAALEWASAERDARPPAAGSVAASEPLRPAAPAPSPTLATGRRDDAILALDARVAVLEADSAIRAKAPPPAPAPAPAPPPPVQLPPPQPTGPSLADLSADRAAADLRLKSVEALISELRGEVGVLGRRVGADVTALQHTVASLQDEMAGMRTAVADAANASSGRLEQFWLIIQRSAFGDRRGRHLMYFPRPIPAAPRAVQADVAAALAAAAQLRSESPARAAAGSPSGDASAFLGKQLLPVDYKCLACDQPLPHAHMYSVGGGSGPSLPYVGGSTVGGGGGGPGGGHAHFPHPTPMSASTAGGGAGGGPSASRQRLLAAAALDVNGLGSGASLDPQHYHAHHQVPGAAGRGPSPSPLTTKGAAGHQLLLANGIVPRQRPVSAVGPGGPVGVSGTGFALPAFPDRSAAGHNLAGSRTFGGGFGPASPGRSGSAAPLLSQQAGPRSAVRASLSASQLRPSSALPAHRGGNARAWAGPAPLGHQQHQHGGAPAAAEAGGAGGGGGATWATTRRLSQQLAAAAAYEEQKEVTMHEAAYDEAAAQQAAAALQQHVLLQQQQLQAVAGAAVQATGRGQEDGSGAIEMPVY